MSKPQLPAEFVLPDGIGYVRLIDWMGDDLSIVRSARVSYDAVWRTGENEANDKKLMRRLWSGGAEKLPRNPAHSTPFESVTMTFEVFAPIFVFRQWHRHRTQSYNELSARYRELPEKVYIPTAATVGQQDPNNKQGRVEMEDWLIPVRHQELIAVRAHHDHAFILYRSLLASGWPKELARTVLPVATYSHMFTTMNLLNFFRFATLRADSHAQYEIRVYAGKMLELVERHIAPEAVALFKAANYVPG